MSSKELVALAKSHRGAITVNKHDDAIVGLALAWATGEVSLTQVGYALVKGGYSKNKSGQAKYPYTILSRALRQALNEGKLSVAA